MFVFDRTTGALERVVTPLDPGSEEFGHAVAVDGDVLYVGAPGDDTKAENSGSVALFDLGSGDRIDKVYSAGEAAGDAMGFAVAADGGIYAAGAPGTPTDSGSADAGTVFTSSVSQAYGLDFQADFAGWDAANSSGVFELLGLDPVLGFGLDLDGDAGIPRLLRSLPRIDSSTASGLRFALELPEHLRTTVRLELQRSTDLGSWTTVAFKNGQGPWISNLPTQSIPITGEERKRLSFNIEDQGDDTFWRIRVVENPEN